MICVLEFVIPFAKITKYQEDGILLFQSCRLRTGFTLVESNLHLRLYFFCLNLQIILSRYLSGLDNRQLEYISFSATYYAHRCALLLQLVVVQSTTKHIPVSESYIKQQSVFIKKLKNLVFMNTKKFGMRKVKQLLSNC